MRTSLSGTCRSPLGREGMTLRPTETNKAGERTMMRPGSMAQTINT